jgi:hypothetical protein
MRRHDWSSKLYEYISDNAGREFSWGENDCCLFVARAVDVICDTKHAVSLASRYHDEATAQAYIEQSGGIIAAVNTFIGPHKTEGRPMRGDVVVFEGKYGHTLGICIGSNVVSVSALGVVYIPRAEILCHWNI